MTDFKQNNFERPRIVLSSCIEFEPCSWDATLVHSQTIKQLKKYADFTTVCPERAIGLAAPRNAFRLVMFDNRVLLMDTAKGKDMSDPIKKFSHLFIKSLNDIDAFILKNQSPTCGIRNVKLYPSLGRKAALSSKARGIFGGIILDSFPHIPIEDETALMNLPVREHFLLSLFCRAEFRSIKKRGRISELLSFQKNNRFLFMLYNQNLLRQLSRLCSDHETLDSESVWTRYQLLLFNMFSKRPTLVSVKNMVSALIQEFDAPLSPERLKQLDEMLNLYKEKKVPLLTCSKLLHEWAGELGNESLLRQSFFSPFPDDCIDVLN